MSSTYGGGRGLERATLPPGRPVPPVARSSATSAIHGSPWPLKRAHPDPSRRVATRWCGRHSKRGCRRRVGGARARRGLPPWQSLVRRPSSLGPTSQRSLKGARLDSAAVRRRDRAESGRAGTRTQVEVGGMAGGARSELNETFRPGYWSFAEIECSLGTMSPRHCCLLDHI